jgi:DNA-binding SARP family transcriptional activator/tetratricopeptide (TPR) repeat protein
VEFRVLGPLEVHDEGEARALGGGKQRELLAILLLNANQVVSTDRLIDELWGGEAPETAQKALQMHVSGLRKVLEPERPAGQAGEVLKTRSPGYVLELEPEQLDLGRFERLAAQGREALERGDPEAGAKKLRAALSLWRGTPLGEFAYSDFAQREIARLEELHLAVLEDRIQADLARGRHAELIGELEGLTAQEPLRERPRAQLMLALYRSGRQAEALEAYREARRALTEELGIEPGRELRALEARILDQDPALDAPPSDSAPRAASGAAAPGVPPPAEGFVGREQELDELSTALDGAFAGRMSLILIAGEPGIGKSRLADQASALGEARGARILWGRCWEVGGAPAYWPWVQALRTFIRDEEKELARSALEAYAPDIAQMLPELNELFADLPPAPSLDPEGARFRLFDSTASFLRDAAATQPIVLILDDMHAADKPSLLLLQFFARSLREARVVLVAAYRDTEPRTDELSEAVAEVRREPITRAVRLGGLNVDEVARVIELTAETAPSDELANAIHRETEGNPLFVGELVRLLASEGRLEDAVTRTGTLSIPQGVREVIERRLGRLSDDCKQLLSVASVLGREFRVDTLARISDRPTEEALDLLEEALAARVVGDLPRERGGLRFSHALVRDSLYGDLAATERLRLHKRALEALEELYGPDPGPHLTELAYHAFEAAAAGEPDRAIDYATRAGDQAVSVLAYEEAARLYEMALAGLGAGLASNEERRCDLLLALGDAQARGGDMPAARETFVRAADVARKLHAPERLARAALGYGGRWIWFRAGKDHRLIELLEGALQALPPGDSELRAVLLARLAGALRDHPVPERRAALTQESLAIARRLDDPRTLAHAVGGSYSALSWPHDTDALLALGRELVRLSVEIGDKEQAFFGHFHAMGALVIQGDIRGARREFQATAAVAQELRQPAQLWVAWIVEAMLDIFAGRLDRAESVLQRAVEVGSAAEGSEATYFYVVVLQGWALRREQGRLAEVEAQLAAYVEDYPAVFIHRCALASLHAELGNEPKARQELDRLAAHDFAELHVGTEWFFGAACLAWVCRLLGDEDRAAVLYEAMLPYGKYNVFAHPEATLGSAWRPLGLLASAMSRWEEAESHFEQALQMNARMDSPLWVAHTQHEYAAMLGERGGPGDRERRRELLSEAARAYRRLGLEWRAERAEVENAAG